MFLQSDLLMLTLLGMSILYLYKNRRQITIGNTLKDYARTHPEHSLYVVLEDTTLWKKISELHPHHVQDEEGQHHKFSRIWSYCMVDPSGHVVKSYNALQPLPPIQ